MVHSVVLRGPYGIRLKSETPACKAYALALGVTFLGQRAEVSSEVQFINLLFSERAFHFIFQKTLLIQVAEVFS